MIRVELKKFQIKIKSIAINYHLNYLKIKKILIHDI